MKMERLWYFLREQKKNNKGSSIVMVLVVMTLLVTLVAIILSLSLMNYRMKTTDRESAADFYTAESALEEIRVGLAEQVSLASADAYEVTMAEFANLNESGRRQRFQTEYIRALKETLMEAGDGGEAGYSVSYLASLIREAQYSEATKVGAKLTTNPGQNLIGETADGLILKNVTVTYYGEADYVTEIKTDIVLGFPDMNFSQLATMPNLLAYALVAQDSVQIKNAAVCNVYGNAYLGDRESVVENASLSVKSVAGSVENQLLISGDTLKGITNARIEIDGMELWANDVVNDSSSMEIRNSEVYIKDDLMLSNSLYHAGGAGTESRVSISGAYYGYGSVETAVAAMENAGDAEKTEQIQKNPADYNSSIILNGVNSTLDISGLSAFKLAGNSYINATEHESALDAMIADANRGIAGNSGKIGTDITGNMNTGDVQMGESLSIRSDQIAWLVPADCIAPETDNGGVNPMPITQYSALLDELEKLYGDQGAEEHLVSLDTASAKLGRASLAELGVSGWQIEAQQVVGTAKSMVYVFLKFDSTASANAFFRRYYSEAANLTKLGEYLDLYAAGGIRLPQEVLEGSGDTGFYFNGNLLASDAAKLYVPDTLSGVPESEGTKLRERMTEEGTSYQNNFAALNTKLFKDYSQLLDAERGKTVYENLVASMISGTSTEYTISEGSYRVFVKSTGQTAIIVNGDFTVNAANLAAALGEARGTLPEGMEEIPAGAKCYVLIASGDITVEQDFTGLMMAGGTITVAGKNVTLTADARNAAQALMAENVFGIHAYDYLKNGETYTVSGNQEGIHTAVYSAESLDMMDYVLYANWTKQ